jgi:hypothetical protein
MSAPRRSRWGSAWQRLRMGRFSARAPQGLPKCILRLALPGSLPCAIGTAAGAADRPDPATDVGAPGEGILRPYRAPTPGVVTSNSPRETVRKKIVIFPASALAFHPCIDSISGTLMLRSITTRIATADDCKQASRRYRQTSSNLHERALRATASTSTFLHCDKIAHSFACHRRRTTPRYRRLQHYRELKSLRAAPASLGRSALYAVVFPFQDT